MQLVSRMFGKKAETMLLRNTGSGTADLATSRKSSRGVGRQCMCFVSERLLQALRRVYQQGILRWDKLGHLTHPRIDNGTDDTFIRPLRKTHRLRTW